MNVIWKFPLAIQGTQIVMMPKMYSANLHVHHAAKILSIQVQAGVLMLWALVDPASPLEPRSIHLYGTGYPLARHALEFLATIQIGPLVWHLFEDKDF